MSQDQYEYPNQEDQQDFSSGPMSGMDSLKSLLKNKRIMMSFGMVAGIYLATHLLAWVLGKEKHDAAVTEPPAIVTPAKPADKASVEALEHAQQAEQRDQALDQRLETLRQRVDEAHDHGQAVLQQMQQVEGRYQTLLNHVQEMVVSLNRTENTVNQLAVRVKQLEETTLKKPTPQPKAVKKALRHFVLKAVVYGRAWVADDHGHSRTVAIGDKLPTYGRVVSIDYQQGVVNTSSGRTIHFDSADR